jgi:nucleoside-diphosphate kinase
MAKETTLVLIKPDGVERGLVGRILARFEEKGLQIVGLKYLLPPRGLLEKHYAVHRERPFYPGLLAFMSSGPVVAAAVRGIGAIGVVRKLMGKTNGAEAEPGTIRGDLGMSRSYNLIHGSDSAEAARTELPLWFAEGEIVEKEPSRLTWVYDAREES